MSDTQLEVQPAPEPAWPPRRRPTVPAVQADADVQPVVPATETAATTEPVPEAPVAAPAAPGPVVVAEPAPATQPPPAPTRRGRRASPTFALDLALPGVRSADIRAELARRERRAVVLLAERERVIRELDAIEAALEAIGEELPTH